jgi:outer membrane protein
MVKYQGMIDARSALEQRAGNWKKQLDTLRGEVEMLIKDQQTKASKQSAKENKLTQQLIQSKQEQFRTYQQALIDKIKTEEQQAIQTEIDRINSFLASYGKENGYQVILAATDYGNVAYADTHSNVTEDVLTKLNNDYQK